MKSVNGLKEVLKIDESTQEIKDFIWLNIFCINFKAIFYNKVNMPTHFLLSYLTTFQAHFSLLNTMHPYNII